jgi:hypothetical protein
MNAPIHSPINDTNVANAVWFRFEHVNCYIEPFGGSASVLFARDATTSREILNDIDGFVTNFYRAVQRNPEAVVAHATWPVNEIDLSARHQWLETRGLDAMASLLRGDPDWFDVQIAGWWFWGLCLWNGGRWCARTRPWFTAGTRMIEDDRGITCERPVIGHHRGIRSQIPKHSTLLKDAAAGVSYPVPFGGAGDHRSELSIVMHQVATRLQHVTILCGDWRRAVAPRLLTDNTGVFLDPPYAQRSDNRETDASRQCRQWALDHGAKIKIAFCACPGGEDMPSGWEPYSYALRGGHTQRMWFSPKCEHLQMTLF